MKMENIRDLCQNNESIVLLPIMQQNPYSGQEIEANRMAVPHEGELPTPEELIFHLAKQVLAQLDLIKEVG